MSNSEDLFGLHKALKNASTANPRKPVLGSWLLFPGASLARMITQLGFDFIIIDCEHGNITDADMYASVAAVAREGASPIVRIPAPENWIVKRTLDSGAHGILCPLMSTAAEARMLVSYAKFPVPKATAAAHPEIISGIRGVGSIFAPSVFNQSSADYVATANKNTFVAVQIETREGLDNCEEIAKVDGVDMLFVGPNDLASSLGYPSSEHQNIPEVQTAIQRILAAAKAAGKYAGMFCANGDQVLSHFEQGFDFMNVGADWFALGMWNEAELAKVKHLR